MPLILLTGYPCAGLTYRATQLQSQLKAKIASLSSSTGTQTTPSNPTPTPPSKYRIHITSAHRVHPRSAYADVRRAEKDARAAEFSEIKRELGSDVFVVVDALNYIKGYRYQLWCYAKECGTTCCVVHVGTREEGCREVFGRKREMWERSLRGDEGKGRENRDVSIDAGVESEVEEPYEPEVFDNLIYRYEEPNGMSRWDSPLFTVIWEDKEPPIDAIWEALVGKEGKGRAVKPHQATVLTAPSDSSHLHHLDSITQKIITHILAWQRDHPDLASSGTEILIPGTFFSNADEESRIVELPSGRPIMLPQLQRLRRQFIALNRKHDISVERAGVLFVEYLNSSLSG